MKRKGKRTLTPRLRFPEFRDRPYHNVRLGDVAEDATERNGTTLDAGVVMGVFKGEGMLPMKKRLVANDISRYKVVKKDWFAYNPMRLNIGSIARWPGDESVLVSPDYIVFRCSHDSNQKIDPNYLDHFRHSDQWVRFVTLSGDGSVRIRIYFRDIATLRLILPSLAEQQKLAECLSALDGLITAEGRMLEALKAHRKGLMQQLLPQPGQTQPRLRFPEFQNTRSGFRQVGTFAKVTTGNKDTQDKVDDGKCPFFVRSQTVKRIDSFSHDCEAVLTSGDGVGVGENYHYMNGKFDFHQRVYCIYEFNQDVIGQFFFHYFSTHFGKRVKKMSAKNSVDSVRMAMITEMPIWMPPPAEQQEIADCLTALDTRLAAQTAKIETLKQHKRGLMQQLFPAPEEQ